MAATAVPLADVLAHPPELVRLLEEEPDFVRECVLADRATAQLVGAGDVIGVQGA